MNSNQMFPCWSTSRKLLTSWWALLSRCHVWEQENLVRKLVAACTKSLCFAILTVFIQNHKWSPQKNFLLISYRKWNWRTPSIKRLHKHSNAARNAVPLYLHSHCSKNLFCFNSCGLLCLRYTTKHLMTAPSGIICFVSLKSWEIN